MPVRCDVTVADTSKITAKAQATEALTRMTAPQARAQGALDPAVWPGMFGV